MAAFLKICMVVGGLAFAGTIVTIWRIRRNAGIDYLPEHWDFDQAKREQHR